VLNFNLVELLGIECSVELSYADKFFMYQLAPIILLGACAFVYAVLHIALRHPAVNDKYGEKAEHLADNVIGGYLVMFNLMYLSLCRSSLDIFNCKEMVPSDGNTYLASTHEQCYEEGGEHMELLPYAIMSVVVYCIGFPLVLASVLYMNREEILLDMELRATQQHIKRKQSSFFSTATRFGRFYKYFHPQCQQWNAVIMFRKFFVASTALLFRENPTFQLSVCLVGMFAMFAVQGIYRPYWSVEEQYQYQTWLFDQKTQLAEVAANTKHLGQLKKTSENVPLVGKMAEMQQGDTDMDALMNEERSSVMENAKSVLFNLNTIESIMLMSVILVNLAGIMLLSGQFEELGADEEYQRDIVTYGIILVICSSFMILFTSLVREIRLASSLQANMAGAKWRAAIRKQMAINDRKRKSYKRFQDAVYMMMRKHGIGGFKELPAPSSRMESVKSMKLFQFRKSTKVMPRNLASWRNVPKQREGTIAIRAQNEIELEKKRQMLTLDKAEANLRFDEKLEKKKKRKKKKNNVMPEDESNSSPRKSVILPAVETSPAVGTSGPLLDSGPPVPVNHSVKREMMSKTVVLETEM
jgi:hypothetical protein